MITQKAISVPIIPHQKLNPKSVDEFLDIFEDVLNLDLENGMDLDFTIDSKLGSDKISPTLFLAKPENSLEIANICKEVYEGKYPYKEIEDPQEVKKMIESPEHHFILFKIEEDIVGCFRCTLDFDHHKGYTGGFMIRKEYQKIIDVTKSIIGSYAWMWSTYKDEILMWYCENRTAHAASQYITSVCGINTVAFFPNKDVFFDKVESDVFGVVFREKALNGYREHQTPLLIRNALDSFLHCDNLYNLGRFKLVSLDVALDYEKIAALQKKFRKDVIKDKYGYQYFQFFITETKSYFSFLHTPCIQNLEKTKYHVNSSEELYVYLEEFLKVIKENRIRYSEVFVSAFSPKHQQLFYEFGFRARGYVPCWSYKKEEKAFEDYVVFNYFEGDINLDYLLMTSELPYYNTKEFYTYLNTESLFDDYNLHSYNTLGALETIAMEKSGGTFDAIKPNCIDGAPHYEFINSTTQETVLPLSILYRPVVLSETRFAQIQPSLGKLTVSVQCKDYGNTFGINAYNMNDVESTIYEVKVPLNDNGFEYPIRYVFIDIVQQEAFEIGYFAQGILINESNYAIDGGNLYFTKSIEALVSEKYPGFEDFLAQSWANEMIDHTIFYNVRIEFERFVPDTTDETSRLALAQATSYTIMDYFSQYTFAEISANMISEIAYTETLTFWSTLISAPLAYFGSWAVSAGIGKLASEAGSQAIKLFITSQKSILGGLVGTITSPIKEVFQEIIEDGFREALIENFVSIAGGSDDLGFWLSSLSTSTREVKGALGELVLGAPMSLKNMVFAIQGLASGDKMTDIRQQISQDSKQKQDAKQEKMDQMGFWNKLVKSNFLNGLFMTIPAVFFGTFSFVALSGLNKMTSSALKLSPSAQANFRSWQHNRRKDAIIEAVGTQDAYNFIDNMKKPSDLDGAKTELNEKIEGSNPLVQILSNINSNPKIETRRALANKFNTITFEGYFNEWIEDYLLYDERFKAFESEFKQIQRNYEEIGVQEAEKETIEIIKRAISEEGNNNLRFLNMFGVEFYDPDFVLIGTPLGSRATVKNTVLKQEKFKSLTNTLDKVNELKTIFDTANDLCMFIVSDNHRTYIPIDSETNLADWLDDNKFPDDIQIFVEPTSNFEFSREQALESFNSLMYGLREVISNIYHRTFYDQDLSVFLGYADTYITNFRSQIKNKLDYSAHLPVKEIYMMKEIAMISIIEHSNEINRDLSEELDGISRLFNSYINNDYYSNMRNNPLYHSLVEFQYSLTVLVKSIGEISKYSIVELETKIDEIQKFKNLRVITMNARKNPSTEVNTINFVKLYNTLKIEYKDQFEQHGLEQEFERIFFDLFKTFKDRIIRPEYQNIVRGSLLQSIIDLLPEDFYIDRNTFSKLIFGDEYYLMKTYFHKNKLISYPKNPTYYKMEENIRSITTDSVYLYAGKPLSQTNLNDLKADILEYIGLYKKDFSSSKTTLPQRVLKYYMEYLFGGNFEKDSAVPWITTVGGSVGELDGFDIALNIAFEFNGPQHYKFIHWMEVYGLSESDAKTRFNIQNINDLNKLRDCKDRDTVLIVLSYLDDPNDWQDIIVHQYELWTGKKASIKQQLSYEDVLRLISEEDIGALKKKFLNNFSG